MITYGMANRRTYNLISFGAQRAVAPLLYRMRGICQYLGGAVGVLNRIVPGREASWRERRRAVGAWSRPAPVLISAHSAPAKRSFGARGTPIQRLRSAHSASTERSRPPTGCCAMSYSA